MARFAHAMLARRRDSSCSYINTGVYEDARMADVRVILARVDLGRWLGMDIPNPCRVSLHASCLERPTSPMVLGRARNGGVLGVSAFNPFAIDQALREWVPERRRGGKRAGRLVGETRLHEQLGGGPILGPSLPSSYVGGMGAQGAEDADLGMSCFDPFALDQSQRNFGNDNS